MSSWGERDEVNEDSYPYDAVVDTCRPCSFAFENAKKPTIVILSPLLDIWMRWLFATVFKTAGKEKAWKSFYSIFSGLITRECKQCIVGDVVM